jgi:hypothetical protein
MASPTLTYRHLHLQPGLDFHFLEVVGGITCVSWFGFDHFALGGGRQFIVNDLTRNS